MTMVPMTTSSFTCWKKICFDAALKDVKWCFFLHITAEAKDESVNLQKQKMNQLTCEEGF